MKRATISIVTSPDSFGRQRFMVEWVDTDAEFITELHVLDGKPVGHRRGQCFNDVLAPQIERLRAQGYEVTINEKENDDGRQDRNPVD